MGDELISIHYGVALILDRVRDYIKILKSGSNPAIIARSHDKRELFIASEVDSLKNVIGKNYDYYEVQDDSIITIYNKKGRITMTDIGKELDKIDPDKYDRYITYTKYGKYYKFSIPTYYGESNKSSDKLDYFYGWD